MRHGLCAAGAERAAAATYVLPRGVVVEECQLAVAVGRVVRLGERIARRIGTWGKIDRVAGTAAARGGFQARLAPIDAVIGCVGLETVGGVVLAAVFLVPAAPDDDRSQRPSRRRRCSRCRSVVLECGGLPPLSNSDSAHCPIALSN